MSKYGAKKTVIDGVQFDSKSESRRWGELKLLEQAGQISDLEIQPRYELQPKFKVGKQTRRKIEYVGDFRYRENGKVIVEDVKGYDKRTGKFRTTAVFDMKAKMLEYKFADIELRIVAA